MAKKTELEGVQFSAFFFETNSVTKTLKISKKNIKRSFFRWWKNTSSRLEPPPPPSSIFFWWVMWFNSPPPVGAQAGLAPRPCQSFPLVPSSGKVATPSGWHYEWHQKLHQPGFRRKLRLLGIFLLAGHWLGRKCWGKPAGRKGNVYIVHM